MSKWGIIGHELEELLRLPIIGELLSIFMWGAIIGLFRLWAQVPYSWEITKVAAFVLFLYYLTEARPRNNN